MNLTSKILACLLATFVLSGCGQSGPLYVPGDPSTVEQPTDREAAERDEDDREDDED
jgi:predicted small lipoprotein YifL